jgi:hypothetical protein
VKQPRTRMLANAKSIVTAAAFLSGLSISVHAQCLGKDALYGIEGEKGYQLRFPKAEEFVGLSDLDLEVTTPKRKYLFYFTSSNGYALGYVEMRKGQLPLKDNDLPSSLFYAYGVDLKDVDFPQSDKPAPAYVLLPEIGRETYYKTPDQDVVPPGMWRLKCK